MRNTGFYSSRMRAHTHTPKGKQHGAQVSRLQKKKKKLLLLLLGFNFKNGRVPTPVPRETSRARARPTLASFGFIL